MRIAVVGSGIAGLVSAWLLSRRYQVTLFEASDYFGGHTHTHDVELNGRSYRVDSGFIVHNPVHYPLLTRLLEELGIASQATSMSFSVRNESSNLEYGTETFDSLFCQRRNLFSPRFLGMTRDLARFYREAPALLDHPGAGDTLGEYLQQEGYGAAFRDDHLVPMASALWSAPASRILEFPVRHLVQFMANHQMLKMQGRPQWCVVRNGSSSYVDAMRAGWTVTERARCPVRAIRRDGQGIDLVTDSAIMRFDQVVLACHSDQALALLADADNDEAAVLGAIGYQDNDVVLHTDASVLPKNRKAWAAWNAFVPARGSGDDEIGDCTVSYWMNLLQGIESPEPFIVTLNRTDAIDPKKIIDRMRYHHPVFNHAAVAAQDHKTLIQGRRNTWFAGAYWGWGFHEDGIRSAVEVAAELGVQWKPTAGVKAEAEPHRLHARARMA